MPQRRTAFLLIALATLPTAAHATQEYKAPADAPTANLRLVNTRPQGVYMKGSTVNLAKCRNGQAWLPFIGGGAKLETERLGMPGSEPPRHGIGERRIQAGVPIAVGLGFHVPNAGYWREHGWKPVATGGFVVPIAPRCAATWFVPEAGGNYEVVFDSDLHRCTVTLFRLGVAADGTVTREDITGPQITFPASSNAAKGDCSALPASQPPPAPPAGKPTPE